MSETCVPSRRASNVHRAAACGVIEMQAHLPPGRSSRRASSRPSASDGTFDTTRRPGPSSAAIAATAARIVVGTSGPRSTPTPRRAVLVVHGCDRSCSTTRCSTALRAPRSPLRATTPRTLLRSTRTELSASTPTATVVVNCPGEASCRGTAWRAAIGADQVRPSGVVTQGSGGPMVGDTRSIRTVEPTRIRTAPGKTTPAAEHDASSARITRSAAQCDAGSRCTKSAQARASVAGRFRIAIRDGSTNATAATSTVTDIVKIRCGSGSADPAVTSLWPMRRVAVRVGSVQRLGRPSNGTS